MKSFRYGVTVFLVGSENQLGVILICVALILDGKRRLFSKHALQSIHGSGVQIARTVIQTATAFVVKVVLEHFADLGEQDTSANDIHG